MKNLAWLKNKLNRQQYYVLLKLIKSFKIRISLNPVMTKKRQISIHFEQAHWNLLIKMINWKKRKSCSQTMNAIHKQRA